ncbi:MAG: hypothetical protein IJ366_06450 [Clostridia bacterium]|nr:hypothetical protein [Clostridia bacterium]
MKKAIILIILPVIAILLITNFLMPGIFVNWNSNTNIGEKNTESSLSEGFYIKKGNEFHSIHNTGGYLQYVQYLIVPNSCYYDELVMNENDELVYISSEKSVGSASITYYEDLDISTIGVAFSQNDLDDFVYVEDKIGNAEISMLNYGKVTAINGKPIKNYIEQDYFVKGLIEDNEYTVSCLQGTQTDKVKVKADCHILKNTNENLIKYNGCIAETNWHLSEQGYVSLNKDFAEPYYDMSTFSQNGFYLIRTSISGNRSNSVSSILIKYQK